MDALRLRAPALVALALCAGLAGCGRDSPGPTATTATTTATASDRSDPPAPEPTVQIDRLTGSSTKLTLAPSFLAALRAARLDPEATGAATLAGGVLSLPITGGNITYYRPGTADPFLEGRVEQMGAGVAFGAGARRAELADLVLDPAGATLTGTASVSGMTALDQQPLLDVDGTTLGAPRPSADGTRIALDGARVTLDPRAAGLLGETFSTSAFRPGLVVGTLKLTLDLDRG